MHPLHNLAWDVREVLQVRELPQKQMIVLLGFFSLARKCYLPFLRLIQSPRSSALFGTRWLPWDGASLVALFLGCSCLGLDVQLPHSHQLPDTLRGFFSSAYYCRLPALRQHLPRSCCCGEEVLWHLELEMLLMYSEFSSWERENIPPRGRSLVSWWPQVFLGWTLLASTFSPEDWALIKLIGLMASEE